MAYHVEWCQAINEIIGCATVATFVMHKSQV
jgi:hypothetical protein